MTIRKSADIYAAAEDYSNFRATMEEAPEGTYEATKAMFYSLDEGIGDLLKGFDADGLVYDKCDRMYEIEAMLFDMLRASNPILQNEIASAIGLGQQLRYGTLEVRERALAQLGRDRDFLASREMPA